MSNRRALNSWVTRHPGRVPPSCRLICFPFAGGGASSYRGWAADPAAPVEICAIQLPGREQRRHEPAIRSVSRAVDLLMPALQSDLGMPFAFFGHSMGALLAYEVARRLQQVGGPTPHCVFVSGHRAPQLPRRKRIWHGLPTPDLIQELRTLNGIPSAVFDHPELLNSVLITIRADLEVVETYRHSPGPILSCPVIAMGGRTDPGVSESDLAAWQDTTQAHFKTMMFDGDHFYINANRQHVVDSVRRELALLGLP